MTTQHPQSIEREKIIKGLPVREYHKKYGQDHKEEIRARRAKERDEKREEYRKRWVKNYHVQRERHPAKVLARKLLQASVKTGRVKRGFCAYNMFDCVGQIEGHHHDYGKPLEVKWLCSKHHRLYEKGLLS